MKSSLKTTVGQLFSVFLLMAVGAFPFASNSSCAGDNIKPEKESLSESLAKLSDVSPYYSGISEGGGYTTSDTPLYINIGKYDIKAIMNNQRVWNVASLLEQMDKNKAAKLVQAEIKKAIPEYLKLYDFHMEESSPHFKIDKLAGKSSFCGPTIVNGNVPEGKIVIAGVKLKILSLVWISGLLEMNDNRELIESIAQLALKQRTDLYEDSTLHPFFKSGMLKLMSLYNRQIIGTGLLGTSSNKKHEKAILKSVGINWHVSPKATQKVVLTGLGVTIKIPAISTEGFTFKLLSPMNDKNFDLLLNKLNVPTE